MTILKFINLKNQIISEYVEILEKKLPYLNSDHNIIIRTESLKEIISCVMRFPNIGQLPEGAITLLDESISYAASIGSKILTDDNIAYVVEGKTGIPKLFALQIMLFHMKKELGIRHLQNTFLIILL